MQTRCLAAGIAALLLATTPVGAATLLICRTIDAATPVERNLTIPAQSVFRDNGRADDPLAPFGNDRWQLRLETIQPAVMVPLQACARVLVRVASDSSVKTVSAADNRAFVYAGSNDLLNQTPPSEDLISLKASVLDQVP
jgi:hypothetical protein